MNFERKIAQRIIRGDEKRISRPIVVISTAAIIIGMALMILSIFVLEGFQNEIRTKVVGFGSHIQVIPTGNKYTKESTRVLKDQDFYNEIKAVDGVKHIQSFAIKPGILETTESIHGVLIKGITTDFDWSFFEKKLVEGRIIDLSSNSSSQDIILSKYVANRLELNLGDKITIYFVQSEADIKPRNFKICGIYETGLQEFDEKYVFLDLRHIQKIAKWGLEAQIRSSTDCDTDSIAVEGLAFGGDGDFKYQWNRSDLKGPGPHQISIEDIDPLELIVSDQSQTLPDTARLDFKFKGEVPRCDSLDVFLTTTGGSYSYYCGGFEIVLDNYQSLISKDEEIYKMIPVIDFQTVKITELHEDIFNWLDMLDINVYIIIGLMIFISLINMTSAILIIILEKTRMIGILKAFGAQDKSVMNIFLYTSARIIGKGLLWGNVIGLGIGFLQKYTGFLSLNPENYFVDQVPIFINFRHLIYLNAGTLVICLLFLFIPALYVTRITPIKAISLD